MLQDWLAKPFQNVYQGSLWPSQREMVYSRWWLICLSLLTLLLDARCCLRVSLPHILFPIISPLLTIHLSKVTSDIVTPFIKIFHVCLMVYYWAEYRGDLGCLSSLSHCCLWDADLGPVCFCPYSLNGYWALLPLCLSFWIALLQEYISVLPHCWPWLCSSFLFSQLSHF